MSTSPYSRETAVALKIVPSRLEYLENWLQGLYKMGHVCHLVVKLIRYGKVFYEGAYGDDGQGGILTADTIFPVSSISKPMVSTLMHLLQEDGLVDVSDFVHRFVTISGQNRDSMRIAHLLMHNSGMIDEHLHEDGVAYLQNELGFKIKDEDDFHRAVLLAREKLALPRMDNLIQATNDTWLHIVCNKLSSRHKPDEITAYCNIGYSLAKHIIDRITGEPTDQFAQRRLFSLLGMRDTAWNLPEEKWPHVVRRRKGTEGYPFLNSELCFSNPSGGGGLKTTVNDILRFAEMIRCGGTFNGTSVLAPSTVHQMLLGSHCQISSDVYAHRAYGFRYSAGKHDDTGSICPPSTLYHGGWGGTLFAIDRESGLSIAIFNANVLNISDPYYIHRHMINILYSAMDYPSTE